MTSPDLLDILGLEDISLTVRANGDLGAVELVVNSGDLHGTLVMSPHSASRLCAALVAALAALRGVEP